MKILIYPECIWFWNVHCICIYVWKLNICYFSSSLSIFNPKPIKNYCFHASHFNHVICNVNKVLTKKLLKQSRSTLPNFIIKFCLYFLANNDIIKSKLVIICILLFYAGKFWFVLMSTLTWYYHSLKKTLFQAFVLQVNNIKHTR